MTPGEARKVARKIVDDWETDIIAQPIDLTEAIAAAILAAAAQQREEDARIAEQKYMQGCVAAEIAAAIRGKQ